MSKPRPTWQFYVAMVPSIAAAIYSAVTDRLWVTIVTVLAVGWLWWWLDPIGFTDDIRYEMLRQDREDNDRHG